MDWSSFFDASTITGAYHIVGGVSSLLVGLQVMWKVFTQVQYMYSTDESNFSERAKLVLNDLRKPLNHLVNVEPENKRVETSVVGVYKRRGGLFRLFTRGPLQVFVNKRNITNSLSYPERRVIEKAVDSRLVDWDRKQRADDEAAIRRALQSV